MAIVVVLYLAVLIIVIAAGWKLYEKAGQQESILNSFCLRHCN